MGRGKVNEDFYDYNCKRSTGQSKRYYLLIGDEKLRPHYEKVQEMEMNVSAYSKNPARLVELFDERYMSAAAEEEEKFK